MVVTFVTNNFTQTSTDVNKCLFFKYTNAKFFNEIPEIGAMAIIKEGQCNI